MRFTCTQSRTLSYTTEMNSACFVNNFAFTNLDTNKVNIRDVCVVYFIIIVQLNVYAININVSPNLNYSSDFFSFTYAYSERIYSLLLLTTALASSPLFLVPTLICLIFFSLVLRCLRKFNDPCSFLIIATLFFGNLWCQSNRFPKSFWCLCFLTFI